MRGRGGGVTAWLCCILMAVDKDEIIHHALQGLRGCLQGDQELTASNVTIAVVGIDQPFTIIEGAELQPYVRNWLQCAVP